MGASYKISTLYIDKYKVKNGDELEVIDFIDIIYLGKKFYPIARYFINKYNFNESEYDLLELKKEDLETFLNIVKTKSIFKYCDKNEWFKSYGNYYYDEEIQENNYKNFLYCLLVDFLNEVEDEKSSRVL